MRYGFSQFIAEYRFLSSSLNSLVKTLVDIKHKTLNKVKEENVADENILKIVMEIDTLISKGNTFKILKKSRKKNAILEEALNIKLSKDDPEILKTDSSDNWNNLKKELILINFPMALMISKTLLPKLKK